MAFLFFGRKKSKRKKEEYEYLDPSFDPDYGFEKGHGKSAKNDEFDEIQQLTYIRTQCEQVNESSRYIDELKIEYQAVLNYLSDIQIIESLPKDDKKKLNTLAKHIIDVRKKRHSYRTEPVLLSREKTEMFNKYADEFPKALSDLMNDEKYLQIVKHDMKMLEAEKLSLSEDMNAMSSRRRNIRNVAIISLIAIVVVFIVFFASGVLGNESAQVAFMVVMLLVVVIVMLIFILQKNAYSQIKDDEKKLARAITLLNKVKIKYVNIYNSVDYHLSKYKVKSAYQLSNDYENYLKDKKTHEKYRRTFAELAEAEDMLSHTLDKLKLYDDSVWVNQVEALVDQKEMIEIKHNLNQRKAKLKQQIDYNTTRIEDAKAGILTFMKKNPDKVKAVQDIVNSYETDS